MIGKKCDPNLFNSCGTNAICKNGICQCLESETENGCKTG